MDHQLIEQYHFGKIIINGKIYQKDLIIFPDRILPNWRRKQGHLLGWEDLSEVLLAKPQVLIIGLGMFGRMKISQSVLDNLATVGIEVISKKTSQACQVFNQRQREGFIIAALHLTC